MDLLERAHHPEPNERVGGEPVDAQPGEADLPRIGRQRARDEVEEGRFAGAVRADEPADLALGKYQVEAVEGQHAPEPLGETPDLEKRSGHSHFTRTSRSPSMRAITIPVAPAC